MFLSSNQDTSGLNELIFIGSFIRNGQIINTIHYVYIAMYYISFNFKQTSNLIRKLIKVIKIAYQRSTPGVLNQPAKSFQQKS